MIKDKLNMSEIFIFKIQTIIPIPKFKMERANNFLLLLNSFLTSRGLESYIIGLQKILIKHNSK